MSRIDLHLADRQAARRLQRPLTHGLLLIIISAAVGYALITNGGFPGRSNDAFAAPVTGLSLPSVGGSVPATEQTVLRGPAINKTIRTERPAGLREQEIATQFAAANATPTEAAVQEDALVRAAAVAPVLELPPYQVYTVEDGDTVSSIAARFGISPEYIVANNAEILDSDFLSLGQSIIVPAGNGILHEVRYGETLSDISARYDVPTEDIAAFAPNGIDTPDDISEAQLVYVPGGTAAVFTSPAANEVVAEETAEPSASTPEDSGSAGSAPSGGGSGNAVAAPASNSGLIWPIYGPISSYFGGSHPLGIDIDGFNLVGSAIVASTSGTVTFAGGNACCSYGLYVVIVSPGGIETLYAHMSALYVTQGQQVSQGEAIGVIGSTGYSTGTHVHFEVIDNGTRVNPLSYLP